MAEKQLALFDDRFLESFVGKSAISNKKIAIIELLANCWDAGATKVEIEWPLENETLFSIKDNGHGMTEDQFDVRFRTLAYNRERAQGVYAEIPTSHQNLISKRPTFGKNGKGRLSGFAFGNVYQVKTWRDSKLVHFKVFRDSTNILAIKKLEEQKLLGHGTEIFIENSERANIDLQEIKKEIGMRFMIDPHFEVFVNSERVTFQDIPKDNIDSFEINIPEIGEIKITVIDVQVTDKTTHQHGIAWHVKNRLVGECTWKGSGSEYLIDGRRFAAKRYIFIVQADCLEEAVSSDWTSFQQSNEKYKTAFPLVQEEIKKYLLKLSKENREATFKEIEQKIQIVLQEIGVVSREKWEKSILKIQEDCPSISQNDLEKIAELLAKLEQSETKYSLISFLSEATVEELEHLTEIFQKWDINLAKVALDEIEYRIELIQKLQIKVLNKNIDEVQDLQPLFHRGLWIFGPEYETIEYTSNQGMTQVIQNLFENEEIEGSRNRPDFAILKDSSVGLYSFPKYDEEGGEIGTDRLTIVELKKPGVKLGQEEVNQAWKYVKELLDKGLLQKYSRVTCFVLGAELEQYETERTTKMDGNVIIQPLNYDTVMKRAKSRMLNLFEKVKDAPFVQKTRIREYLKEKEEAALLLF